MSLPLRSLGADAPAPVPDPATAGPNPPAMPRRALILGGAGAIATGVAAQTLTATPAHAAGVDPVLHLLRRTTFGPTPALVAEVRKIGLGAWLDAQLDPVRRVPDSVMDQLMKRWTRLTWRPARCVSSGLGWQVMYDLLQSQLAHALFSRRQLFETVVDFWTNHLVVHVPVQEVYDCAHLYSRDVIRAHALGRYADMMAAACRHPAMLKTLDNSDSTKEAPNENYAREMLELHTVGIGHFTEADVRDGARLLTGLSVDRLSGEYVYKPERHWVGPVRVLGWSHANGSAAGGEAVALSYVTYLARHPLTARRIATKLAIRYVSDTPPSGLIDRLAATYLAHDTAIAPVLKQLFTSTEFAHAVGAKFRTPYEDGLATMRICLATPDKTDTQALMAFYWQLKQVGQLPMGWPAPNGYPDVAGAWTATSSLVQRWNFHLRCVAGWTVLDLPRQKPRQFVSASAPKTYGALIDQLASRVLMQPVSTDQKNTMCTFIGQKSTDKLRPDRDPALGWRLPYLIALLLSSAQFMTR